MEESDMNAIRPLHAKLAATVAGILALQSAWACELPAAPRSFPEGSRADLQAMLKARQAVDRYVEQVYEYMHCENDGVKLMEVKAEQKRIVERFNAEVRSFKARTEDAPQFKRVSRD
jgi:hypothetical protein